MPNRKELRGHRCPVAAFQKLISGKYKLRIMWDLKDGPRRYGEIRSGLLRGLAGPSSTRSGAGAPGISPEMPRSLRPDRAPGRANKKGRRAS
jgi:hypothetical protein